MAIELAPLLGRRAGSAGGVESGEIISVVERAPSRMEPPGVSLSLEARDRSPPKSTKRSRFIHRPDLVVHFVSSLCVFIAIFIFIVFAFVRSFSSLSESHPFHSSGGKSPTLACRSISKSRGIGRRGDDDQLSGPFFCCCVRCWEVGVVYKVVFQLSLLYVGGGQGILFVRRVECCL